MAKPRKEYLEIADKVVLQLMGAVARETNEIPDWSVIKRALTRAYNNADSHVRNEAWEQMGLGVRENENPHTWRVRVKAQDEHKEIMLNIIKEK